MLFMSSFALSIYRTTLPPQVYYSPALGFNSTRPLPSGGRRGGRGGGERKEGGEERMMRSGECISLLSQKKKRAQTFPGMYHGILRDLCD